MKNKLFLLFSYIFFYLLIAKQGFCNNQTISDTINICDTIIIVIKKFKSNIDSATFSINIVGKKKNIFYSNTEKKFRYKKNKSIWNDNGSYFIFYLYKKNGRKLEEGYWAIEAWHDGYYKHYYPNGNIKSEGVYIENQKTGKWIYYDETGTVIKTEFIKSDLINFLGTKTKYTFP